MEPVSGSATTSQSDVSEFQDVKKLVWGPIIVDELFKRWSQGFVFSQDESSALVQFEGGPCAIIAPVQAFVLKFILSDNNVLQENRWRMLPIQLVDQYLVKALTHILCQARNVQSKPPLLPLPNSPSSKLALIQGHASSHVHTSLPTPSVQGPSKDYFSVVFFNEPLCSRMSQESDPESTPPSIIESQKRLNRPEQEIFHRNLRVLHLESREQLERILTEKLEAFKGYYGILLFLYSLILTKGIPELSGEMSEAAELIDNVHGHGSQSLINLMLTGRGVNYVWDHEQDVGGMKLVGIVEPVEIGFLTLLETLRYCEVGSFFKNPKFPVWVVGSETHLTVLFSTNMNLCCPETPAETARRVFHAFDPEGNNFISTVLLEDVLKTLDLVSDSAYVDIVKSRLDPETLGIILLNDFMEEFFPNEKLGRPDTFKVFHYNGQPRSSVNQKVTYQEGNAILLETDLRCLADDNKILTCLQTKWPSIDVSWISGSSPSIN